jgi:hypothetical protein
MTPDKQAAPSEWVELGVELADEAARWAYKAGDHGDRALLERRDAELAALRAHLEAKEREHLATNALLEKERESRKEAQMENVRLKDHLARHGIEARAVLAKRDALVKQLAEALKYARRMVKPSECDSAYIDAALAAYQEKT